MQRSSKISRAAANDFGKEHVCFVILASQSGRNSKFGGKKPPPQRSQRRKDYSEHAAVLPTGRLIQQFRFNVERRFDVHLRARIGVAAFGSLELLASERNSPQQFSPAVARRRTCSLHLARTLPSRGAISPNGEQTIGIGPERYLACLTSNSDAFVSLWLNKLTILPRFNRIDARRSRCLRRSRCRPSLV